MRGARGNRVGVPHSRSLLMPFKADEFYVGMIAYFTISELHRHPQIRTTNPTRDNKARPFICYAEADGECYWTCLTGTANPQRRTVSRKWLRSPKSAFWSVPGDLIIGDGASSFAGPIEAFAQCSGKHDNFKGMYRPMLIAQGVAEVQQIVRTRGGLMPGTGTAQAA